MKYHDLEGLEGEDGSGLSNSTFSLRGQTPVIASTRYIYMDYTRRHYQDK